MLTLQYNLDVSYISYSYILNRVSGDGLAYCGVYLMEVSFCPSHVLSSRHATDAGR